MKLVIAILLVSFSSVAQTSARIPPVEIARVVNANLHQFRACYDQGRARNPTLTTFQSLKFPAPQGGDMTVTYPFDFRD